MDGYAEIVSEAEFGIARAIGVPINRIILNGPYKPDALIAEVICGRGIVNIDSFSEAVRIVNVIKATSVKNCEIGIRCNFKINERESRFGIPVNSEDFYATLKLLADNNIKIKCLHCHIKGRTVSDWEVKSKKMIEIYHSINNICAKHLILDLGGGLPALINEDTQEELLNEYAEAIGGEFQRAFGDKGPILCLEPGTALAAPCMSLVTSVVDKKRLNDKEFISLMASTQNISRSKGKYTHYIQVIHQEKGFTSNSNHNTPSVLCGYTCLEDDIFCELNEPINIGDIIVFKNIGAYSIVNKPPFIMPNFPIIEFDNSSNTSRLIRSAETISVFCTDEELKLFHTESE